MDGYNTPSFDQIFALLCEYIQTRALKVCSDTFQSLKLKDDKVYMAYQLLNEANLLSHRFTTCQKSSEESAKFREKGNKEFLEKKDYLAIQTYSLSVATAPIDSLELALAYANRSAVNHRLKDYEASIYDIDKAVAGKYPEHLLHKLYERKGKCQSFLGLNKSAKESFQLALDTLGKSQLDEGKIESLRNSLSSSLNICSDKYTPGIKPKKCLPFIAGGRNDILLSASALVEIGYSQELGRHLIATSNIEPGETLVVEKPFASVLLPTSYNNYCFHCKKRCHSLIPCLQCTMAMFCNEECRSNSLEQNHKYECSVVPILVALGFTKIELIALRTLIMASNQYKSLAQLLVAVSQMDSVEENDPKVKGLDEHGHYNSDDYRTVHHLVGNMELRFTADVFRKATAAAFIVFLLDRYTDYFSLEANDTKFLIGGLLLHYLMIAPSNAHEISEMVVRNRGQKMDCESVEIGGALYPILSLINHSCDPNVVRHSHEGDTNVLTAIQFIAAGEQILDNYGYHHAVHDLETRQSHLFQQYHFICQCVACCADWPRYVDLPQSQPVLLNARLKDEVEKSSGIFQGVLSEITAGKKERKLRFLYAHLALLHRTIQRPWKEYSACQEAIKQCLSLQANHYFVS